MSEFNDRARSAGPDGQPPRETLRQRLARLLADVQDRLWSSDEKWAAARGYDSWRSPSGWKVTVRDPRFNLRQACGECDGTGRHRITGAECDDCDGIGVVTLPGPDEDPDDGGAA